MTRLLVSGPLTLALLFALEASPAPEKVKVIGELTLFFAFAFYGLASLGRSA